MHNERIGRRSADLHIQHKGATRVLGTACLHCCHSCITAAETVLLNSDAGHKTYLPALRECVPCLLLIYLLRLAEEVFICICTQLGPFADMLGPKSLLVRLCLQQVYTGCSARCLAFRILQQTERELLLTQQHRVGIIDL